MFISRRKYERVLQEAADKAWYEAEKETWKNERERSMQQKLGDLERRVRILEGYPEHENVRSGEAKSTVPY